MTTTEKINKLMKNGFDKDHLLSTFTGKNYEEYKDVRFSLDDLLAFENLKGKTIKIRTLMLTQQLKN